MINRVVLTGRLGNDPDFKQINDTTCTAKFSLPLDNRGKNKEDNKTEWIDCVAWNSTAEIVNKIAKKGMLVAVDGRLQKRSYQKQDGSKGYIVEVVAENVQFLEPKSGSKGDKAPIDEIPEDDIATSDDEKRESATLTDDDIPF